MRSSMSILAALALFLGTAWSWQAAGGDMHAQHAAPMGSMGHPHEGMGFSPTSVTRHFLVTDDGGAMVLEANDPADAATRDAVRAHLSWMAKALTAGDFSGPSFLQDATLPGAAAVRQFAPQIKFLYVGTERGGKLQMSTDSSEVRAAIHQLLEAQMQAHHTQDAAPVSPVKTLTADQVQGLLNAEGMGMAKAAELNHYPGPRHVLQLASDLHLTPEQATATQQLFDSMHQTAVSLGKEILARERALDELFASGQASPEEVSRQVTEIAVLQGKLRATHLLTHLKERALLTPEQIAIYDQHRHAADASGEHSHQH
jgi:Spy/CpxP family protein refolding chaperone